MKRYSVLSLVLLLACDPGPLPTDLADPDLPVASIEVEDPGQYDAALERWWALRARVMELHFSDGLIGFGTAKALLDGLEPIAGAFYVYDEDAAEDAIDALLDLIERLRDEGALSPETAEELTAGSRGILGGVVVGPEGGEVELDGEGITLDIPAGAVDAPIELTVTPLPLDGLPSPLPVGALVFDFGPDGTVFNMPITMTIPFDPATLPPGTDPSELRIHKLVAGEWVQMDAGLVDLDNNTVSAFVDGFSTFAVLLRFIGEDTRAPRIGFWRFWDPVAGTWVDNLTVDVTSSDVVVRSRFNLLDDITGAQPVRFYHAEPDGLRPGLPPEFLMCGTTAPTLVFGGDNNGVWECEGTVRQGFPAADYTGRRYFIRDDFREARYYRYLGRSCQLSDPSVCFDLPVLTVTNSAPDAAAPVIESVQIGVGANPSSFGSSASVNVSLGAQELVARLHVTDVGTGVFDDGLNRPHIDFYPRVPGSSLGQANCALVAGDEYDGVWDCPITVRQYTESGIYGVGRIDMPDRAGNATGYTTRGSGTEVCDYYGDPTDCLTSPLPEIEVSSAPDILSPLLTSLSAVGSGNEVTVTAGFEEDISGLHSIYVGFVSPSGTQNMGCYAYGSDLESGDLFNGVTSCSFAFGDGTETGTWTLRWIWAYDLASNLSRYLPSGTDGEVCTDIGDRGCVNIGNADIVVTRPPDGD